MALGAVLVDSARVLIKEGDAPRVEGTTQVAEVASDPFRCRLTLPTANESVSPSPPGGNGRVKVIVKPQMMWDRHGPSINFDQRVEITSAELGTAIWQVDGDPEPLRKKRIVIGYLANLKRVREGTFEAGP